MFESPQHNYQLDYFLLYINFIYYKVNKLIFIEVTTEASKYLYFRFYIYVQNTGGYSSMVEHLYVAQHVPRSNRGIRPGNLIIYE